MSGDAATAAKRGNRPEGIAVANLHRLRWGASGTMRAWSSLAVVVMLAGADAPERVGGASDMRAIIVDATTNSATALWLTSASGGYYSVEVRKPWSMRVRRLINARSVQIFCEPGRRPPCLIKAWNVRYLQPAVRAPLQPNAGRRH